MSAVALKPLDCGVPNQGQQSGHSTVDPGRAATLTMTHSSLARFPRQCQHPQLAGACRAKVGKAEQLIAQRDQEAEEMQVSGWRSPPLNGCRG